MTCLQPPKGSQHRFDTYNIYELNWEREKNVGERILMWYTGSLLGYHDRLFSLMLDLFFQRSGARSAQSNFRPCRKMEEQVHTLLKTNNVGGSDALWLLLCIGMVTPTLLLLLFVQICAIRLSPNVLCFIIEAMWYLYYMIICEIW